MFFSVVVPTFNQIEKTTALLRSLEKQTFPLSKFEVIISDDGSTDGTPEFLVSYSGPLKLVTVIPCFKGSRAKARNSALQLATGTHLLFLDGDLFVSENLMAIHAEAHLKSENAVFIGKVEPCEKQRNRLLDWYRVSRGGQKKRPGEKLPARYFATNNSSVPMSLIKAVGLFNENYTSWGGEDTEMGYSLAKKGASFYYLYEAVAFHDHEESLEEYKSKLALFAQSGLYELLRNCPEHGSSGYLKLFRSGNILVKVILAILFSSHVQRITEKIAPLLPARKLAYLMYDHVTYAVIYRNLAKARNKLIYL